MDFHEMRAAYIRAVEKVKRVFPVVERKPAPVVTPSAAASVLRGLAGRQSWGSE